MPIADREMLQQRDVQAVLAFGAINFLSSITTSILKSFSDRNAQSYGTLNKIGWVNIAFAALAILYFALRQFGCLDKPSLPAINCPDFSSFFRSSPKTVPPKDDVSLTQRPTVMVINVSRAVDLERPSPTPGIINSQ